MADHQVIPSKKTRMKQIKAILLMSSLLLVSAGCFGGKPAVQLVAQNDEFEVYVVTTEQGSKSLELKNISHFKVAVFNSLYDMTYSDTSYTVDANGKGAGTKEKVTDWTSIVILEPDHAFSYPLDLDSESKFTLSTKKNRLGEEGRAQLKKSKINLMRNDIPLDLAKYK